MRWLGNALSDTIAHDTIANWLQAQASVYIFLITLALWLLRFAMSSTWLYWLATWFRPLFEVLQRLLVDLYVFPICLALGLTVAAYHIVWRNRRGRGWGVLISTFAIGIIGIILTRDPLSELYSDNGLLTQGRNLGFTVAQAAMNNGAIASGGSQGQLNSLTGLIADATVRMPMQLWNFGTPVDDIGTCANAYSAALLTGEPSAPAHAMGQCGAPQALAHAQQLDGSNFALGVFFCLLGLIFTFFICYVAYSYIMVAAAAFLNAILALFAAGPAMIHGAPRRRALRRLKEFFRHAFLVFAYVTYISFAAVIVLKMAAPGGYAAQVNMTHPVALLVLIALMSAVATGLFFWLKRELGDHTRQDLTHAVSEAIAHGRSGYQRGQRGYERGRDVYRRGAERFNRDAEQTGDDPDAPLTGPPAKGHPPGGRSGTRSRPPGVGRSGATRPPSGPTPGQATATTGRAAGTAAAGGGATAAEAGAAVVAPEVVAGVVVANEVKQRMPQRRGAAQRDRDRGGGGPRRPTPSRNGDEHLSSHPQQPAPGRSTTLGPGSSGPTEHGPRHNGGTPDDARPYIIEPDTDPSPEPPAPGRSR